MKTVVIFLLLKKNIGTTRPQTINATNKIDKIIYYFCKNFKTKSNKKQKTIMIIVFLFVSIDINIECVITGS